MERGNKTIIKVISVVVLLIGAGLAVTLLFSSSTLVGTGVDELSDVGEGDYYELKIDADTSSQYTLNKTKDEYYHWLYYGYGVGQLDPNHPKNITVNGEKVKCDSYYHQYYEDEYAMTAVYHVDPENKRTYGYEIYKDGELTDNRTLVRTNFDLDKEESEQTMTKGLKMEYIVKDAVSGSVCPSVSISMDCTVTQIIGSQSTTELGKWIITFDEEVKASGTETSTVAEYISDLSGDVVVTTDGLILQRYEYLMPIDYDEFLEYISKSGGTVNHETSVSKKIKTVYGERSVTEHTVSVFGTVNTRYVVDFGENGVIYSISEVNMNGEGAITMTIQSSSMISEVMEVKQPDPINITFDDTVLAIVIMATAIASAILIGRFVFKFILKK